MRWKIPAGALVALAFLIPAAPAVAQAQSPGLNAACQTVERKVYKDFRELVTIDLDTATDPQMRSLVVVLLDEAIEEKLSVMPVVLQQRVRGGTPEELRDYLKTLVGQDGHGAPDLQERWVTDLRIVVGQTMTGAGANVKAAAQKVLDEEAVEAYLAYLNDGLYAARALDCASQPTATPTSQPTTTPSATPTAVPTPASSTTAAGGDGGGLPVTGAQTATMVGIGGALLLLGGAVYVIGRRRRARFVA
ncbi:LPXTG cell wall anchor domain-containing protein [Micromonospora sp. NPDC023888]|uniref:LPXTG cell wall anchor domain-containing protein n=1 Tax=Micromonospora sp. NPDC023888 TaxID=3155607 RepID=UPI0034032A2E